MEKVLVFQRIFFEFQVSKTFNIFKDFQIKACKSLKPRGIFRIPRRTFALSVVSFKMNPLRKSKFLC